LPSRGGGENLTFTMLTIRAENTHSTNDSGDAATSANLNFDFRKIYGFLFYEKGKNRKIKKKIMTLLIR